MKNKKTIYFIIFILIIIFILLILLLFVPNKSEIYSTDYYLDVKTNLVDSEENKEDVSKIQDNLNNYKSNNENSDDFEGEIILDQYTTYEDGEYIIRNDNVYAEALANGKFGYKRVGVAEEQVKEIVDINYYPEDCYHLIQKNINSKNLQIVESEEAPIVHKLDAYGDEGFFRVFDVYNKETNTTEDSLAVNLVTGDIFGFTTEGILYDYDFYPYNPDYEKNLIEPYKEGIWLESPYEKNLLWERLYKCLSEERYYTAKLSHFKDTDNTHFYKIYWEDIDDYILVDYYTGEMTQVVNGVKSSVIDAFK